MADFLTAYKITRDFEGGYSNHVNDTGGETYKGIARNHHPKWRGWAIIDELRRSTGFPAILNQDEELQKLVHELYKTEYWDKMNLDRVKSQVIANELFDTGVNMGIGRAGEFIQRVLNVANKGQKLHSNLKPDGDIGNNTINAINAHSDPYPIWKGLNALQGAFYIEICEKNPSQEVFFHGWMKRVF